MQIHIGVPVLFVALGMTGACVGPTDINGNETPGPVSSDRAAVAAAFRSAGIPLVLDDEVPVPPPGRLKLSDGTTLDAYAVEASFQEGHGMGHAQTTIVGWAGYQPEASSFDQEFQILVVSPSQPEPPPEGATIRWDESTLDADPYLLVSYTDFTTIDRWRVRSARLSLDAVRVTGEPVDCGRSTDSTRVSCEVSFGTLEGTFEFELRPWESDGSERFIQPPTPFSLPLVRARFRME